MANLHRRRLSGVVTLALLCASAADSTSGNVTELTIRNFASTVVDSSSTWFVQFYAKSCDPCERLAQKWQDLAKRLDGKVKLGQLDASNADHESLANAWGGITNYPALKLFVHGAVYEYDGEHSVDAMASFASGGFNRTSLVVSLTSANLDDALRDHSKPLFLKFYAPWCPHCQRLIPTWDELARRLDGKATFAKVDATIEQEIAETWEVSGYPTLILVWKGQAFRYEGARDLESLQTYVLQVADGAGGPGEVIPSEKPQFAEKLTSEDFFAKLAEGNGATWFINFFMPGCGACKELSPIWEGAAAVLQSDGIRVAKVDVKAQRELTEAWGIERFPTMKLIVGRKVYEYEGARAVEDITAFARQGYKSAKVTRTLPDFQGQASSIGTLPFVLAFVLGGGLGALIIFGVPGLGAKSGGADVKLTAGTTAEDPRPSQAQVEIVEEEKRTAPAPAECHSAGGASQEPQDGNAALHAPSSSHVEAGVEEDSEQQAPPADDAIGADGECQASPLDGIEDHRAQQTSVVENGMEDEPDQQALSDGFSDTDVAPQMTPPRSRSPSPSHVQEQLSQGGRPKYPPRQSMALSKQEVSMMCAKISEDSARIARSPRKNSGTTAGSVSTPVASLVAHAKSIRRPASPAMRVTGQGHGMTPARPLSPPMSRGSAADTHASKAAAPDPSAKGAAGEDAAVGADAVQPDVAESSGASQKESDSEWVKLSQPAE